MIVCLIPTKGTNFYVYFLALVIGEIAELSSATETIIFDTRVIFSSILFNYLPRHVTSYIIVVSTNQT